LTKDDAAAISLRIFTTRHSFISNIIHFGLQVQRKAQILLLLLLQTLLDVHQSGTFVSSLRLVFPETIDLKTSATLEVDFGEPVFIEARREGED
jgi:hypothetical protein